jgi:hypothetical protein
MAETAAETTTVETKTPGKIVSAGQPSRLEITTPIVKTEATNVSTDAGEGGVNGEGQPAANAAPAAAAATTTTVDTPSELTDDQLKAYFEKQGINFEGIDKLKEKLTASVTEPTITEEQKEKAAIEKEQRIINEHLSRKGTVEQFTTFKNIVAADKRALGLQKEVEDLVASGFTPEEATELANERYFQLTDEQIEGIEDKDAKAKAIKQKEVGLKKLENKGAYLQNTAKSYLDILSKDLAERDAEKNKVEKHTSKVEDAIKKYQRKDTLALGQIDGQDIAPIDFEYSDTALTSAKELLSDAAKLDQNLFTNDGGVNIDFILPHLVKSFSMQEAVKKSYLTGQTRAIETFEAKFGSTPPKLGGNGKPTGTPGKITSFGEKQVFKPTATK